MNEENNNKGNFDRHEGVSLVFDLNNAIIFKWNDAISQIKQRYFYEMNGAIKVWDNQTSSAVFGLYSLVRISYCSDLLKAEHETKPQSHEIKEILDQHDSIFRRKDIDEILKLFADLDLWLYSKGVTKFDTKKIYDRSRVEISNKAKGL
jgi:hypothetical protein